MVMVYKRYFEEKDWLYINLDNEIDILKKYFESIELAINQLKTQNYLRTSFAEYKLKL